MKAVRVTVYSLLTCALLICGTGIGNAQIVSAYPQALNFVYQIGGANPAGQNLLLSSDVPTQFTVTISGAPWLTVGPTTGITPSNLVVTAKAPADAVPGTLSGVILIGPPASADSLKTVVAVSLQILGPAQGVLTVTPTSLTFDYRVGGPAPPAAPISITSNSNPTSFNLTTSTPWLTTLANSYVTPATAYVSVAPLANMGPGTYTGFVYVNSTSGGSTKQVAVTLRISAGGSLVVSPGFLNFSYQPGGVLPGAQSLNIVNSSAGTLGFTVSSSTSSGGGWISYSPISGSTPGVVVVSVVPGTLSPGAYYGTVTIAPNGGGSVTQIPISLTIYNSSQLIADPPSLGFSYQAGGALPPVQYVSLKSTGSAINYTVALQGPSWVTTPILGGVTPSAVGVTAAPPSTTPAGTYTATLTITPTNGGGTAVIVPISVLVTATNYISVGQTSVSFNYTVGGTAPPPVVVPVTSSGGPLHFNAAASSLGFEPWLNVSQSSFYTPAELSISVNPQGLAAGTYAGAVLISSDAATNGDQTINVTLVVTTSTSFSASPAGLIFSYQLGLDAPPPQLVAIKSQGSAADFTTSTSTKSGGSWLTAAGSGTTPASVAVTVNFSKLGPGIYTGEVQVKSSDASIPVLHIPVVFSISASPVFQTSTNQLVFQYQTTGATPASQKVTVNATSSGSVVYYPTFLTADGGSWLSASPDVSATPSDLIVSVNPKGLATGVYYGLVVLNDVEGDTPDSVVPVTLQISDSALLVVPPDAIVFTAKAGASTNPTPQTVMVGSTTGSPIHVTTSGGSWLQALPTDGFGSLPVTISAIPDGLAAGYYLGVVSVEIPGVTNTQQLVPVALIISQ